MEDIFINIEERSVPLEELAFDVIAAKLKGLSRQFAFTPETVDGLIRKIMELNEKD